MASRSRLETAIAGIWQELLGTERIESDDDFFELGGESLTAVRMLAAIDELLLVPVSFADFLQTPTVRGLADEVQRARATPASPPPVAPADGTAPPAVPADGTVPPPAVPADGTAPCTFAQERLWFVDRLYGANAAYNEVRGARVRGPLAVDALRSALREVVRRHAALRTSFADRDGVPVQVVAPELEPELEQIDLTGEPDPAAALERVTEQLASRPFDLERGPLMRAQLLRVGDEDHVLQLVLHHIVSDGWSHVVLLRELGELYRGYRAGEQPSLPQPRTQYPDYARRLRSELGDDALSAAVAPWLARLAGAPATLDLPTDRPRPATPSYRGATHVMALSPATAAAVRGFARAAKATTFATMLAAYYVLLHRYSSQEDMVVGATTSGRAAPELEDGIGLFVDTVALRCEVSDKPSFHDLVGRVRDTVMWAVAHQSAPFDQVVARLGRERDLSRHPVFSVFCAHVAAVPMPLDGAEPYQARPATSRFDLTLFVEERPDEGLGLAWEYSSDLFDAATIQRMALQYVALLEAALADPRTPIDQLPLRGPDAAPEPVRAPAGPAPGAGAAPGGYPVACMHELFARRAAETPDAVAVTYGDQSLTYGELNRQSNRLAHRLRRLGARPETMVALYLEPSLEMIVAILGVLKSGAAYVPLDPEYPAERAAFVLQDTAAPLLVSVQGLLERLPAHAAHTICLDGDADAFAPGGDADPEALATPESLAYVIYTSGSTGRPKGVQVEHRQVARLFSATDAWYGFGPGDTWVLLHSYAFDFSVWEIWGALAYGGRLVISPLWTTRSPQALADLVADEAVTVMNATPSLFVVVQDELLRRADRLRLRSVVFGGEALAPATLAPWFAHFGEAGPTLVNMYGITETTVHVTYRPLTAADCDRDSSPIGVPIPDLSLHLLDARGQPVPAGVAGELFVGGAGVARGYLNRPELTAERFIESPFGDGRLYRTGDVARRLPDGELDFRGRIDDQVKIRGFRIELGEIRAAMREVAGVADGAVIAVQAAPGDTRLAAYVVPDGGTQGSAAGSVSGDLLAHLERKLPAYMVPSAVMLLDRLPLTRNGKTDRKALPAPVWETRAQAGFQAPRTPTEALIAEIWRSVLGLDEVGSHDNFFNLGGHSLLAARVATQVRERCAMDLSVRALFEQPTLSAFAAYVDSLRPAAPEPDAVAPAEVAIAPDAGDDDQLSFQQQQLLIFDALEPGNVTYNAALAVRVRGELDRAALRTAIEAVVERHEALRTALVWDGPSARQVVLPDWSVELAVVDLAGVDGAQRAAELDRRLRERARRPFDLSTELMMRPTLFRLAPTDHVLLFAVHHIAFDAWAVEVFYRDLGELYDAARTGRDPRLPTLALQYRDFTRWQRERLSGELLDRELDFWRAQLAGAPTILRLPTDKRRPPMQTFDGAGLTLSLGAEVAEGVRELCQSQQVTPYMLLLAQFATLLYRRSGQDDILFGGPMANRELPGLENLVGYFANTIVVRARLAGNPRFSDLLAGVRESVLQSYEHQEVPLELVVDAVGPDRDPGMNPLFQVNFRVRIGEPPVLELTGTDTSPVTVDLGLARFDLALELHVLEDRIEAEFNYNTALFERHTIERLAADFAASLRQSLAAPDTRLLSFELSEPPAPRPATVADAPPIAGIRRFREAGRRG